MAKPGMLGLSGTSKQTKAKFDWSKVHSSECPAVSLATQHGRFLG